MDTASRKLLLLQVWTSNIDLQLIGGWYIEHLLETRVVFAMMRLDRGTETGIIARIFCSHRTDGMDPIDTILYTPSTSNQVSYLTLTRFFTNGDWLVH